MRKKYIVRLLDEEKEILENIIKKLKGSSQKVRRAQILLKANVDGPNWTDAKISEAFSSSSQSVEAIRERFIRDNLNTHTRGAFYEVFSAEEAREIVKRIEFCYQSMGVG